MAACVKIHPSPVGSQGPPTVLVPPSVPTEKQPPDAFSFSSQSQCLATLSDFSNNRSRLRSCSVMKSCRSWIAPHSDTLSIASQCLSYHSRCLISNIARIPGSTRSQDTHRLGRRSTPTLLKHKVAQVTPSVPENLEVMG